jgi:hypothetical protein
LKVSDKSDERPDISGLVLVDSTLDGPTCVGQAKGEDKRNDTYTLAVDLMKMAIFGKEAIDSKQYQGILSIHAIGKLISL